MTPKKSEELELFLSMHALDSAFRRVLQSIHLLVDQEALPSEVAEPSVAFIEVVHDHIKLALGNTLGPAKSEEYARFSSNLRQEQSQLIDECLMAEQDRSSLKQKRQLTLANFESFRQRKTEDA